MLLCSIEIFSCPVWSQFSLAVHVDYVVVLVISIGILTSMASFVAMYSELHSTCLSYNNFVKTFYYKGWCDQKVWDASPPLIQHAWIIYALSLLIQQFASMIEAVLDTSGLLWWYAQSWHLISVTPSMIPNTLWLLLFVGYTLCYYNDSL